MHARMQNPAVIIPDAMPAILNLFKATKKGGVPQATLELVHLRASQINGCSYCVDTGVRSAKKASESDERLFAVAAGGRHPTSPTPNAPRWRSPRPPPGSATGSTRYPTRSGMKPPGTTTSSSSRR